MNILVYFGIWIHCDYSESTSVSPSKKLAANFSEPPSSHRGLSDTRDEVFA